MVRYERSSEKKMKKESNSTVPQNGTKYIWILLITIIFAAVSAAFERQIGTTFAYLSFTASVLLCIYVGGVKGGMVSTGLFLLYLFFNLLYPRFIVDLPTELKLGQTILLGIEGMCMSWLFGRKNKVNEDLLESEQQKRVILNSAPQALITIDDNGTIVDLNPAAEKIFGYSKKKMKHEQFEDLIIPSYYKKTYKNSFPEFLKSSDSILGTSIELITHRADDTQLPIEMNIVQTNNGDKIFYTAYIRDITKQKQQEAENAEIIQREQKALKKAQEAIQARDEFLSIASHELKTPLTSMLLQLQTVLHSIRNVSLANFSVENLLKMLEGTEKQTTRLSKMINDLLNVSLITTGKLDLELEKFDLVEVTRDIMDRFSARIQKDNYEITVDAPEPVIGNWDKLRIEQVIANLLSNAMKYGNNQPIAISIYKKGDRAFFIIADKGIGVPIEQQKKIFERFKRGVSSKDYKGLGVGLYITNQIVQTHKGTIHLESEPGIGSTFMVELPLNN